jgi:rhodanese-related sulfurtransferase
MNRRHPPRLLLFCMLLLSNARCPAGMLDWREPWRVPAGSELAAVASDEFAWRLFVAINWPADPAAGVADPTAAPGANRPVVWERWENTADVYRDDGADPGPWRPAAREAPAAENRFESLSREDFPNARHIVSGRMVPLVDPAASAHRLIETHMNRPSFDYIRAAGLYNLDGQIQKVVKGEPVEFPPGAIEVKASWRPIRPAERSRYHTLRVRFADGTTRVFGLNALNIAAKELPQWFWASFEHIDNATRGGGEGWLLASRDRFACPEARPNCGRAPTGIGLEAGVWKNYRLRGTMTAYVDAAGMPQRLGNSELEAGFQESASCMTCHSRAALALVDGAARRLEIFDTQNLPLRRGYVGVPDPNWFHAPSPNGSPLSFVSMDFVWSLARAKPRRNVDAGAHGDPR